MSFDTHYRRDRTVARAIALLLFSCYIATASLRFHMIDEVAIFTAGRSLASRGTLDSDAIYWTKAALGTGSIIARGTDGHYYSTKDLVPLVLAAPFVWMAHHLGVSPTRASLLLMPLVTAITGALLYQFVRSWGYQAKTALISALAFGLGSMAWPYAGMLFGQTISAFGLLLAFSMTVQSHRTLSWRTALLGGLGMGITGMSAAPIWVVCPALMIYLVPWRDWSKLDRSSAWQRLSPLLLFGAVIGAFAIGQGIYNTIRFGALFSTGHQQFGGATVDPRYLPLGLFGQLISAPRGIFWFVPYLLLIPAGIALGWRKHRSSLLLAIGMAVPVLLAYSIYYTWWAGHVWGPRYLLPIIPLLTVMIVPALDTIWVAQHARLRYVIATLLLLSMVIQVFATLFDYMYREVDIAEQLHLIEPSPNFLVAAPVLTDFHTLPLPRQLAAARVGQWDVLWISEGKLDTLLFSVCLALIVGAVANLLLLTRSDTGIGILVQCVFTAGVILFMLFRYPQGPEVVPDLDPVVGRLDASTRQDDVILAIVPYSAFDWLDSYQGRVPDLGLVFEEKLSDETRALLDLTLAQHPRVWVVSEGTFSGDPVNGVQRWMANHALVGEESHIGGYRLVSYTVWQGELQENSIDALFGEDGIRLSSYAMEVSGTDATQWVNVRLVWMASAVPERDYSVFVHLLDANGALIAQHDGTPRAGYSPTSTWKPDARVVDPHSLLLPESLAPGEYVLQAGLYDPVTGRRLMLPSGDEALTLQIIRFPIGENASSSR